MVALTIGMATYDDFDGVYFTLQSLRLYQDLTDTEIVVIADQPAGERGPARSRTADRRGV